MPLHKFAIIVICLVAVFAPISIYIMLKYTDLDRYRERMKKTNDRLFRRYREGEDAD